MFIIVIKNFYLISVSGLEVVLVDGGVDVTLAGEEVERVVHLHLGHALLHPVEDVVPVDAGLVRALLDEAVHEVVVAVAEALIGGGGDVARAALHAERAAHHGLAQAAVGSQNLAVDLLLQLPQLEVAVDHLQGVRVVLGLVPHLADLEGHDVLLVLLGPDGAHHLDGTSFNVLGLVGSFLQPLDHLDFSTIILDLKKPEFRNMKIESTENGA